MDTVRIRNADEGDRDAILVVVAEAMGGDEDVALVETIWRLPGHLPSLELVATIDGVIVGHVLYSAGHLDNVPVPGLAPLAVAPSHQNAGIGSALVTRSLSLTEDAGFPVVIVTGDPKYYGRFGFEPASKLGIRPTNPDDFADLDAFMAKPLGEPPNARGTFVYAWQTPPESDAQTA